MILHPLSQEHKEKISLPQWRGLRKCVANSRDVLGAGVVLLGLLNYWRVRQESTAVSEILMRTTWGTVQACVEPYAQKVG